MLTCSSPSQVHPPLHTWPTASHGTTLPPTASGLRRRVTRCLAAPATQQLARPQASACASMPAVATSTSGTAAARHFSTMALGLTAHDGTACFTPDPKPRRYCKAMPRRGREMHMTQHCTRRVCARRRSTSTEFRTPGRHSAFGDATNIFTQSVVSFTNSNVAALHI